VITVRAIPARPHATARLARVLGLDGNPLRRASDRVEAWIRIGVLAAVLVAGPLAAVGAGHWAYQSGAAEARAWAGQRHNVRAVLLQSATPSADLIATKTGGRVWVRARWLSTGAGYRTGTVPAPVGSVAGSMVTVWFDASGQPAATPPPAGQVASQAVLAAVLGPALVALAALAVLRLIQRRLNRRRLAAWDAAWSAVGPRWTGRAS
jgi:hypothetical protein